MVDRSLDGSRLWGTYLFGDYGSARVFGLRRIGTNWAQLPLGSLVGDRNTRISTFGEDERGHVYVADNWGGRIFRIEDDNLTALPTVSPAGGAFIAEQSVKLMCSTPEARIHYTTDGRDPDVSDPSVERSESILVSTNLTLKARAIRADLDPGPIRSEIYRFRVGLRFSPSSGPITNDTLIRIDASTPGTTIWYSTNGVDPKPGSSVQYEGPFPLHGNSELRAIASKPGFDDGATNNYFGLLDFENVVIQTVAGGGSSGYVDGSSFQARFSRPEGICIDSSGALFVADRLNHRIRRISPSGMVTTVAGGARGFADGFSARFSSPVGIAIDGQGNLFVSDRDNLRIRLIRPDGDVSTFAGNERWVITDDFIPFASFRNPAHLEFDTSGNLFVGDYACVRQISPDGMVQTLAGPRTNCCGWSPDIGVGLDSMHRLFLGTSQEFVRWIDPAGLDALYAGSQPGHADTNRLDARFTPLTISGDSISRDIVGDARGNIFITDQHSVRKITATGSVKTLAPNATTGLSTYSFTCAAGICIDSSGTLFVTDAGDHTIKKISIDADFDGVPDVDEHPPLSPETDDRAVDSDGDGQSNADEYISGSDPVDPNSVFHLDAVRLDAVRVRFSWKTRKDRFYRLNSSTEAQTWSPHTQWLISSGPMIQWNVSASERRYFRVEARLP